MALFGRLFAKESCAICGQEVGTLKKRKLADGVMCKDCAAKLSPWFEDRKESTIAEIQAQLATREANRTLLQAFQIAKVVEGVGALYLDTTNRCFCALPDASSGGLFSSERIHDVAGLQAANPEVLSFDQVESVRVDVTENRNEVKRTVDGEQVSFDPKHWRYGESFCLTIAVDHPYIQKMRVQLGAVTIEVEEERLRASSTVKAASWLFDDPDLDVRNRAATYENNSVLKSLLRGSWEMPDYAYGFRCTQRNWESIQQFARMLSDAEEARTILLHG